MSLLVLIVMGATLGWLASILARTDKPGEILRQIAAGTLVAIIAGVIANDGSVLGGLSFFALGVAVAATVVILLLYHMFSRRRAGA